VKRAIPIGLIASAALALGAAPALATADRAEYAANANPVCAAANAQSERLLDDFSRRLTKLSQKENESRGRNGRSPFTDIDRMFSRINARLLALSAATNGQLQNIAPAPGDEAIVGSWLAARTESVALLVRSNRIDKKISRLFNQTFSGSLGKGFKAIRRAEARQRKLEARQARIAARYFELYEVDVELGTKLGATYCVTSATRYTP
jgi:hypothetical protein